MAVRKLLSNSSLISRYTYSKNLAVPRDKTATTTWKRNPCWLTLPSITEGEQKINGIHAIDEDSCFLAFFVQINTGNYIVDWGDGVVETIAGGTQAQHQYDWNNPLFDGTNGPVTFQDAANTVTRSNHGYANGDRINFSTITTTTGINAYQQYYVINATTDTFQLALTPTGSAIDLTNDGTGTILPYKQAIVTITPAAGKNITQFDLCRRHTTPASVLYSSGWLDMNISTPFATITWLGLSGGATSSILHYYLERVNVLSLGSSTSMNGFFYHMTNLRKVETLNIPSTVTDIGRLFAYCRSIEELPNFTTSNSLTSVSETFRDCLGLQEIPWFNTSGVTNFASFFRGNNLIKKIPMYDTGNGTNFTYTFEAVRQVEEMPVLNTAKGLDFTAFLNANISLEYFPFVDTSKATNVTSFFSGCHRLSSIPGLNTISATTHATFLNNALSLKFIPKMNFSKTTSLSSAFRNMYSATEMQPILDVPNVTDLSYAFAVNFMQKMPTLITGPGKVTTVNNMYDTCYMIKTTDLFDTGSCTNFTSMHLNNYRLISPPTYNTANGTNFTSMFQTCYSLVTAPPFNTANATIVTSMYYNCFSLLNVPEYNFNKVDNASTLFRACVRLEDPPVLNLPVATTISNIFYDCFNLKVIPKMTIPNVTNATTAFLNCYAIRYIPDISFNSVSSAANLGMFSANWSLSAAKMTGMRFSFSVANFALSDTALNEIYTNLPTVTGQTITVTGNPGVANDTPSIATAKGWTVTG